MYDFFPPDENELISIIGETLNDIDTVQSVQVIQSGWTNITMDVKAKAFDYIFRFPRNLFFAKMMVKDCIFCQFLHGKVSLNIPNMQLKMNKNRPFSMHQKIKGTSLLSQMDNLSFSQQSNIVRELSIFLKELHALPIDTMPKDIKETLGEFLDCLASVHEGDYDFAYHDVLRKMENQSHNLRIVHGDFHPGNILIDEGRVSGIIDFSFASISDVHADLGRFMGRSNQFWGNALVHAYQEITETSCDLKKVYDVANVFHYVEYKYVQYMQSYHPEINIPQSVLQAAASNAEKFASKKI